MNKYERLADSVLRYLHRTGQLKDCQLSNSGHSIQHLSRFLSDQLGVEEVLHAIATEPPMKPQLPAEALLNQALDALRDANKALDSCTKQIAELEKRQARMLSFAAWRCKDTNEACECDQSIPLC